MSKLRFEQLYIQTTPSSLVAIKAINPVVMFTKTASPDMWMGFLRAYYHEETIIITVHRAQNNGPGSFLKLSGGFNKLQNQSYMSMEGSRYRSLSTNTSDFLR